MLYNLENIWPGWQIEEMIGQGSYGKVYRVRREEMGETYYAALKVIEIPASEAEIRRLMTMGMDGLSIRDYFEGTAKSILGEITMMKSLKSAPNIVYIEEHYLEEHKDSVGWTILIRMELLESLRDYQKKYGNPDVNETVKIGRDICAALACCEQKNIIHRDVKPDNIFRSEFGVYKLGDFGIAKQMEGTKSAYSQKGTGAYMAPEVARGEKYDSTVDIYSLGIMLYELLNRQRGPFIPTDSNRITPQMLEDAQFRRLSGQMLPSPVDAPPALARIILKACHPDPSRRWRSAGEFGKALEDWQKGIYEDIPEEPAASSGSGFEAGRAQHWSAGQAEKPSGRADRPAGADAGRRTGDESAREFREDPGKRQESKTQEKRPESRPREKRAAAPAGKKGPGRGILGIAAAIAAVLVAVGIFQIAGGGREYTVTVIDGYLCGEENGVLVNKGTTGTYKAKETVRIKANPDDNGYNFRYWKVNRGTLDRYVNKEEQMLSDQNEAYFTMPKEDVEVEAWFYSWEYYPWVWLLEELDGGYFAGSDGRYPTDLTSQEALEYMKKKGGGEVVRSDPYVDLIGDGGKSRWGMSFNPGKRYTLYCDTTDEEAVKMANDFLIMKLNCVELFGLTAEEICARLGASEEAVEYLRSGEGEKYYHSTTEERFMYHVEAGLYDSGSFKSITFGGKRRGMELHFTENGLLERIAFTSSE